MNMSFKMGENLGGSMDEGGFGREFYSRMGTMSLISRDLQLATTVYGFKNIKLV